MRFSKNGLIFCLSFVTIAHDGAKEHQNLQKNRQNVSVEEEIMKVDESDRIRNVVL